LVNKIVLNLLGLAKELLEALDQAVRRIFSPQLRREQALAEVESRWGQVPEVRQMVEFVRSSPRGVIPIRFGESAEA
jgi:UDP-N-acetylglucosamine acyltransferase